MMVPVVLLICALLIVASLPPHPPMERLPRNERIAVMFSIALGYWAVLWTGGALGVMHVGGLAGAVVGGGAGMIAMFGVTMAGIHWLQKDTPA